MESGLSQLEALRRFMAPRWFVAGRAELISNGFSPSRVKNWHQRGRLVQVLRGVYAFGRDIETREAAWRAALMIAGPGSALTGRSACEAWGLIRPRIGIPTFVEVATESGKATIHRGLSSAMRRTWIRVVRRRFEPGDIRRQNGLAVTRVAWALIDLAVNAPAKEVRFAFLEACRLEIFDRSDVDFCYRRLAGRRGAKKLRPLLALWVPELKRIRSVLEGLFLLAWVERGLPMPKVNVKVHGYEVDAYWPEKGVVVELDGNAFHNGPVQRSIDLAKQRDLEARGLIVIRITYEEFEADPKAAIDRVLAALELS